MQRARSEPPNNDRPNKGVSSQTTSWTLIAAAAEGAIGERNEFIRRYMPVIHAYLNARWRSSRYLRSRIDDASQDVFLECFQPDGPLTKVDRNRRFRTYLYGIVRNIALRIEQPRRQADVQAASASRFAKIESREADLERVFDRAWALQVLKETAELQMARARLAGNEAERRVELLRLRIEENLPVRVIAQQWDDDAGRLHRELSKAKVEFRNLLREIVSGRHPLASAAEVDDECREIVSVVSAS